MDEWSTDSIDDSRLKALQALQRPGGPPVLDSVLELFVLGTPRLLDQMHTAVAAHDRAALRVAAHTLKSSSANLGAAAFAAKSRVIEAESEVADWPSLQARVEDVANEALAVIEALRLAVNNLS